MQMEVFMQVTTASLAPFQGGQMEIQNKGEKYLFRGETATIVVEDGSLKVKFAWLAKGEGFPPIPRKWVKDDRLDYEASLEIYRVSDIGPGSDGGGSRLCFDSSIVGEMVVLYPPGTSTLERSKVEGL